jgi:ABC-2 type transport system permease protein
MKVDQMRFRSVVVKEFFGFVNSPLAYIILVPFLLLSHYLFYRTALVLGDANLRPFIELLPWFLVVIAPALAMRSFGDEQRRGTVELLFAHPITEWSLSLAKLLGLVLFYGLMLATTLALPLSLVLFSEADLGLMASQYLGALMVGTTFLSIGLATSVYIRSQIGSFLVGAALCFGLLLMGMSFVVLGIPAPFNRLFIELGVVTHLNTLARGVVDIRDIIYFVTIIGVALTASVIKLSSRKLQERPGERRILQLTLVLIIGIGFAVNVLMAAYPVRLDLTRNQRYSLSAGTKELLGSLPDRVTVTLYTSANLPGPMQVALRETGDRLKDFSRYGGDNLRSETEVIDADNSEAVSEALAQGIQEITFNQVGAGSFQAQTGFLGITVRYGDQTEVIPFVQDPSNLEYELSRMILGLTREDQPTIAYVAATDPGNSTAVFEGILSEQYTLSAVDEEFDWDAAAAFLVVDDGSAENATAAAQIQEQIAAGTSGLLLVDGVAINQQLLTPVPSRSDFLRVTSELGVVIGQNLVYDLQQNENIQIPTGSVQYILPYPFWLRANLVEASVPWSGAGNNVLLGWPSSMELSEASVDGLEPLLVTGPASGAQTQPFTIQPDQLDGLEPSGGPYTLAAVSDKDSRRLGIVADAHIATDSFLENAPENQAFLGNMVDWIVADEILTDIPQRTAGRTVFSFVSTEQVTLVQSVAIVAPALIVGGFGIYWIHRRRKRTGRIWSQS